MFQDFRLNRHVRFPQNRDGRLRRFTAALAWIGLGICLSGCHTQPASNTQRGEDDLSTETRLDAAMPLRVITWNVEAADSDADAIGQRFKTLGQFDIHALLDADLETTKTISLAGWESHHFPLDGFSGSAVNDLRNHVNFNARRLERLRNWELLDPSQADRAVPPPLVVEFLDRATGQRFLLVVTSTVGCRGPLEARQVTAHLEDWVQAQSIPVMITGSFFRDSGQTDSTPVLDQTICRPIVGADSAPTRWLDTNDDGVNDFPSGGGWDDFFEAGFSADWALTAETIANDNDFPDTPIQSRFRPLILTARFRGPLP